ncbi:MAG: ABC transporter ATP-binding protein/permease [Clostridia bacterium]|nr:ABC transporter ATP-binding protein/permease [Clostridia bacterium]
MKLILKYLRKHLGIFLISTAFLTMEAVADLMQPTFMSKIVDNGIRNADTGLILLYGLIMLAIAAAGAFCAVMRNRFASRTSQTVGNEVRLDMYRHVQTLSLENIDRLQPASIITRMTNDVTQIQDFIASMMRMMVKAPITGIGAIVLIIIQTPRQAPVMGLILLIAALLIWCNIRIGYPKFNLVQKCLDRLNRTSREFLTSIRVVKAFSAEDQEREKFSDASEQLAEANRKAQQIMAVFTPLINLVVNFGIVLLLWVSQNQDEAQIGRLMASVNYMTQVMFAVTMIANVMNTAVRAMASSARIQEVLDEQPAQNLTESTEKPEIRGGIRLENMSFTYAGASRPALNDLSFEIEAGTMLGIIGPTGSGKTTLVNLIPRFYDATEGRILLDGTDVRRIDPEHLRRSVAVVSQKALLFSGTIRDNLKWGRADASDEQIREAARIACADEFIEKSEKGYDTRLGQGGVNLSGGQKQRLSIARALLCNPRVLILDDCTSALDAQTESKVLDHLTRERGGMTVLLISQRISTVMRADRILCLDDGRVQGFGTHDELMRDCRVYREIRHSQIGGGENE